MLWREGTESLRVYNDVQDYLDSIGSEDLSHMKTDIQRESDMTTWREIITDRGNICRGCCQEEEEKKKALLVLETEFISV